MISWIMKSRSKYKTIKIITNGCMVKKFDKKRPAAHGNRPYDLSICRQIISEWSVYVSSHR